MIEFPLIPANAISIAGRSKVCGVGINDADYLVQPTVNGKKIKCPIYTMWSSMILRCYDPKYSSRFSTYHNCLVDERWHSFMAFREWVLSQPTYLGLDLDKDLLFQYNKIYSPEKCLFVPHLVNVFLCNKRTTNTGNPIGVTKTRLGYVAEVSLLGKGRWRSKVVYSIDEAIDLYSKKKRELAIQLAGLQSDKRVADGLLNLFNHN